MDSTGAIDEYVYTRNDLGRDYIRALLGLAICIAPFVWLQPALYFTVILVGVGAVFAALLWQTVMRQITRVVVDDRGITMIAVRRRTIAWDELRNFQLSYFTTWKNLKGFMEIKLKGPGVTMNIGSGIVGFRNIAKAASEAAYRNRLTFKEATLENLRHLNVADPRFGPGEDDENETKEDGGS